MPKPGSITTRRSAKQLREMLGLAIRARKPDARGLRDIVDAEEDEIEPPRADAARFEIEAQLARRASR